jgi:chorismate mutase
MITNEGAGLVITRDMEHVFTAAQVHGKQNFNRICALQVEGLLMDHIMINIPCRVHRTRSTQRTPNSIQHI